MSYFYAVRLLSLQPASELFLAPSFQKKKGKFPVEAVDTMAKICLEAENSLDHRHQEFHESIPLSVQRSPRDHRTEAITASGFFFFLNIVFIFELMTFRRTNKKKLKFLPHGRFEGWGETQN